MNKIINKLKSLKNDRCPYCNALNEDGDYRSDVYDEDENWPELEERCEVCGYYKKLKYELKSNDYKKIEDKIISPNENIAKVASIFMEHFYHLVEEDNSEWQKINEKLHYGSGMINKYIKNPNKITNRFLLKMIWGDFR